MCYEIYFYLCLKAVCLFYLFFRRQRIHILYKYDLYLYFWVRDLYTNYSIQQRRAIICTLCWIEWLSYYRFFQSHGSLETFVTFQPKKFIVPYENLTVPFLKICLNVDLSRNCNLRHIILENNKTDYKPNNHWDGSTFEDVWTICEHIGVQGAVKRY